MKIGIEASLARNAPADWSTVEALFDHVPDTVFFVKDAGARYLVVNQSLVARCGLRQKSDLIGRCASEVYPRELGATFAEQDARVLRTGRPIHNHLELHWHAHATPGWCLTTKLPLRDASGTITGLVGISRDLQAPGDRESIPRGLVSALEYLEESYSDPISPAQLAKRAGLSPLRFARLIKRIYRLTPSQLITKTRLTAASRFLRETHRSVAEIGVACGFYDHSAFTRAFRSATGLTPTACRQRPGA